jgi:hypothetical protein
MRDKVADAVQHDNNAEDDDSSAIVVSRNLRREAKPKAEPTLVNATVTAVADPR